VNTGAPRFDREIGCHCRTAIGNVTPSSRPVDAGGQGLSGGRPAGNQYKRKNHKKHRERLRRLAACEIVILVMTRPRCAGFGSAGFWRLYVHVINMIRIGETCTLSNTSSGD
jgi:hypothetical protein